jgi:iron complex outermembrane receptor protein
MKLTLRHTPVAAAVLLALGGPLPAQAQRGAADPDSVPTVVISASALELLGDDMISPVTSLGGDELVRLRESTLGETLGTQRGIASSHFGAGASRPIIHGMEGPRVKILSDGAEVQDASSMSPDHAVGFEPLLAERIEVLRGPSALAYGGGAVGGVINILDRKIPTRMPGKAFEGSLEVRGNSAAREKAGAMEASGRVGSKLALHAELAGRDARDYRVGEGWEEGQRVPGGWRDSGSGSAGLSWIGARGYLGLAYSQERADYGIPGHGHEFASCHPHGTHLHCGGHGEEEGEHEGEHDHEHGHEVIPAVRLDSRRWDLRGEYRDPLAGIRKLRLRAAFTDYRHDEMEEGAILTTFTSRGRDLRIEAEHAPLKGVRGVFGLQSTRRDFAATGEEAYVAPSLTTRHAAFLTEEYRGGDWRVEGAVRHEWQDIEVQGPQLASTSADGTSLSVGAVWRFAPRYSLRASVSRAHRLPTAEELYADGVHLATGTYEMGKQDLDKETSRNLDLTLRKFEGDTTFSLGLFRNRIRNFIYASTLDVHEGFQLIEYAQRDALFTGVDLELRRKLSARLSATLFGDYVRARFDDGAGHLPRIPAGRAGVKLDGNWNAWHGFVEFYRVTRQDRVAAFESATPGYNMLNLGTHYDTRIGGVPAQFYARLNNLNDALAFSHTSFIKRAAPLAGRNLTAGLRLNF